MLCDVILKGVAIVWTGFGVCGLLGIVSQSKIIMGLKLLE
jgi:hypothetical protein